MCKSHFFSFFEEMGCRDKAVLSILSFFISFGVAGSLFGQHPEQISTVFFAAVAAFFTYKSYISVQEKFRFDLFKERLNIYTSLLKYCSMAGEYKHYKDSDEEEREKSLKILNEAEESFRGLGYHRAKALFGRDINILLDKLNTHYSWLVTNHSKDFDAEEWLKHSMFIMDTVSQLSDIMKPYIYFGDIRNAEFSQKSPDK